MAEKTWVGPGGWNTAGNWLPSGKPAATSEVVIPVTGGALELDSTAGLCKQLVVNALYKEKVTSKSTAVLKIGTSTGTGTALKLTSEVKWELNGSTIFEFVSTVNEIQKITLAGQTLPIAVFIGEGGKWELADTWKGTKLECVRGTLNTAGQTVEATNFIVSGTLTRTVDLKASLVKCSGSNGWDATTTTNLTFEAGTSTIELSPGAAASFTGGGLTYNNVTVATTSEVKLAGANTFATLAINNKEATAKKGCKLESGVKQTLTGLTSNGASGKLARLESTVEGERHKISKASGTVELKFTFIKDSEAEGGATFIAGEGCEDGGNNVGWTFSGVALEVAATIKVKTKDVAAGLLTQAVTATTKLREKTVPSAVQALEAGATVSVRVRDIPALLQELSVAGVTKVRVRDVATATQTSSVAAVTQVRTATHATVSIVTVGGKKTIVFIFDE